MEEPDTLRRIAAAVAAFLDRASGDAAAQADAQLELAGSLGELIDDHLAEEQAWSPWWRLDDAVPTQLTPVDGLTVDVSGVAYLLADSSAGDRQPFSAKVRLTPSRVTLERYTIRFGDAAVGLGPNPAAERQRRRWPEVEDWLFRFEGPAPGASDISAR